jgi:hypothetical protein
MYKKLDFQFPELDLSRIKGNFFEGYGPFFHTYHIADAEYLHNIVSKKLIFNIAPTLCSYTEITHKGVTDPHTDTSMTALNYYINSAGGTTTFYTTSNDSARIMVQQRKDNKEKLKSETYAYDSRYLTIVDQFSPNDHEPWLLDIHQIHSVSKMIKSPNRTILRWLWYDVPFDDVLNSIKIISE